MSAVQDLITALNEAGLPAEWQNTGGGCFAIAIPLAAGEILVTDREDTFAEGDLRSDNDVWGFFARAYALDGDGVVEYEDDMDGWLFTTLEETGVAASQTDPERGEYAVDLSLEVVDVYGAIMDAVEAGHAGQVPVALA